MESVEQRHSTEDLDWKNVFCIKKRKIYHKDLIDFTASNEMSLNTITTPTAEKTSQISKIKRHFFFLIKDTLDQWRDQRRWESGRLHSPT